MYFNEFDPFAAAWLRAIYPAATVDERSITDVKADGPIQHGRCHWFGGIGGWEYALQLAGWPAGVPVWTGSCPCQPFSISGNGLGVNDERHMWPEFLRLITECHPATIFGEQVASPDGRDWLAGVRADLEALGYAVGAADLCAAGVGAPHVRQRLFWVADDSGSRCELAWNDKHEPRSAGSQEADLARGNGHAGGLVLTDDPGPQQGVIATATARHRNSVKSTGGDGPWSEFDIVHFSDGKTRRIESGTQPLAHGVPNRVGRLRGYGNAIVPQVAAEFIGAFIETLTQ